MKNETNIIKQIYYDETTGKVTIYDKLNNNYSCNMYGDKLPKFLPRITGFANFKERKDYMEMINVNEIDRSIYRPQNTKFEGYFQFPKPLSAPFFNENLAKKEKKKLLEKLEKTKNGLSLAKNKNLLELKSNQGLHYFTSSLNLEDESSKIKFMKLIDNYIEEFKIENKYKLDLLETDPKVKALKKLRKILSINLGNKIINNRKIESPRNEFKIKYMENLKEFRNPERLIGNPLKKTITWFNSIVKGGRENRNKESISATPTSSTILNATNNVNNITNNQSQIIDVNNLYKTFSFYGREDKYANNLTFISNLEEREENMMNETKIKERNFLNTFYDNEKRLLKGYKVIFNLII